MEANSYQAKEVFNAVSVLIAASIDSQARLNYLKEEIDHSLALSCCIDNSAKRAYLTKLCLATLQTANKEGTSSEEFVQFEYP
jgi:hypothetical protein